MIITVGTSSGHATPYRRRVLFQDGSFETGHCVPQESLLPGRSSDRRTGLVHPSKVRPWAIPQELSIVYILG
jgi:hypothetical protein